MGTDSIDWDDLAFDRGFNNPRNMLYFYYIIQEMTQTAIGEELGIHCTTVSHKMKEYGIPARVRGETK